MKKPPTWNRPLTRILRFWGAATAAATMGLIVAYFLSAPPVIGQTRKNLSSRFREMGWSVREKDIIVAGGLPGDMPWYSAPWRPVVFLGADRFSRRTDLWVARVRLSPGGVPLDVGEIRNLSLTFLHNERIAAVSAEWVFWQSPHTPGLYHLVWLRDPDRRFRLQITPEPQNAVLFFSGAHAHLAGSLQSKPISVRIDLETGAVEAPENLKVRFFEEKTLLAGSGKVG
ncbi:hypothetical protein KJ975_07630 [Myxococcota bacterium]|nr:hypothetical protein [Myxococcota bacterium]